MPLLTRKRDWIGTRLFRCLTPCTRPKLFQDTIQKAWRTSKSIMFKKSSPEAGFFRPRVFVAFLLCSAGVCLAMFTFNGGVESDRSARVSSAARYMPIPGGDPDDLDRMEAEWNNRLTYPTGVFDPAWVRQAAAVDKSILRSVPFGAGTLNLRVNTLTGAQALDPLNFTALGPRP